MKLSIGICTWNRAELLDRTLAELSKVEVECGSEWEVIVVDNNSTDHTDDVIKSHASELPMIPLFEPSAGQSYAANLALEHATGDLMVWTDDDVLVSRNWITEFARAASEWPSASFFAGPVEPLFETTPPKFIGESLQHLLGVFAICDNGQQEREFRSGDQIFGANMAFRMNVAREFTFKTELGRISGSLLGGADTDVVDRVRASGLSGVCVPKATVRHFIPNQRISADYIAKWYHDAGVKLARTNPDHHSKRVLGMPRWALRRYCEARTKDLLHRTRKGPLWMKHFNDANRLQGYIGEYRRLTKSS